jgi:F-type H+-transporting ATPase subunit gamma
MANLKEIRTRIASVSSTQQITSAMKMVSASKLRKSQNAILKLRPYSAKMTEIIQNLCGSEKDELPLARQTKIVSNVLLLVLTSNKGLCSTFNSNVIKATNQRIEYYKANNADIRIDVKTFGKKGTDFFKKQNSVNYVGENDEIWDNLSFEMVAKESDLLIKEFLNQKYDKIEIIYNQFKNASTQILTYETFLPISFEQEESNVNNDYIFEPSKVEIINSIIPQSLKTQLFKCFLDSFASEHGARMTSMHKATDNATNLLKELKLTYNKARQASITNEIIEICSGAEALK